MVKHKHHIIPIHAGGTNSPNNLIELTVAEHAEAHKILFEKYGRWQDEVAWRGLSGQIATAEINRIKNSERQKGKKIICLASLVLCVVKNIPMKLKKK